MVFKIIIGVLALLGLIFVVGPFFNYSVFDFQCQTSGCSGQVCKSKTIISSNIHSTCEFEPEYGCNKNCESRNLRCGFDEEFRSSCVKCVQNCKIQYSFNKAVAEAYQSCLSHCYNFTSSTNST